MFCKTPTTTAALLLFPSVWNFLNLHGLKKRKKTNKGKWNIIRNFNYKFCWTRKQLLFSWRCWCKKKLDVGNGGRQYSESPVSVGSRWKSNREEPEHKNSLLLSNVTRQSALMGSWENCHHKRKRPKILLTHTSAAGQRGLDSTCVTTHFKTGGFRIV